jgi:hypothetical protein
MTVVVGREAGPGDGPTVPLGRYRAPDGSSGAPLEVDVGAPHAALVVGKRGYGKSHTLGVLAEALARRPRLAPVVVDPMGEFPTLAEPAREGTDPVPADVVASPAVSPAALDPRSWCDLLGLSPEGGAGGLVWQAAAAAESLQGMRAHVTATDAAPSAVRAAVNHIDLAGQWGVFDTDGLSVASLAGPAVTVVDLSGLDPAPSNAVVRAIAGSVYRACVAGRLDRFPWLLVDEAQVFFEGVAAGTLETVLARGRSPGVSLVLATQRPGSLPGVAVSQSDLLVAHRLTARDDVDALARARPTYATAPLAERLPAVPGDVLLVDDVTETVHTATVRRRHTPHGGATPEVGDTAAGDPG